MLVFLLYLLSGFLLTLLILYMLSLRTVYSINGKHVLVRLGIIIIIEKFINNFGLIESQITGGSSGIGKALAAEALKRGAAAVTIVARTEVENN
jgi:alanine-alpha-ketoisovalerate/valine-pyruvate aminotransferase